MRILKYLLYISASYCCFVAGGGSSEKASAGKGSAVQPHAKSNNNTAGRHQATSQSDVQGISKGKLSRRGSASHANAHPQAAHANRTQRQGNLEGRNSAGHSTHSVRGSSGHNAHASGTHNRPAHHQGQHPHHKKNGHNTPTHKGRPPTVEDDDSSSLDSNLPDTTKQEEHKDVTASSDVPPPIPALGRRAEERKKDNSDLKISIASMGRNTKERITVDINRDDNSHTIKKCQTLPVKNQKDMDAPQCDYSCDSQSNIAKFVDGEEVIWDAGETNARAFYGTLVLKDGHKYFSFRVSDGNRYKLETKYASNASGKWQIIPEIEYNRQIENIKDPESIQGTVLDLLNPDEEKIEKERVVNNGFHGIKYKVKTGHDNITRIVEGEAKNEPAGDSHDSHKKEDSSAPKSEAEGSAGAAALVAGHDIESIDDEDEVKEDSYIWRAAADDHYCTEALVYPEDKPVKILLVKTHNPDGNEATVYFIKDNGKWNFANQKVYLDEMNKLRNQASDN